MNEPRLVLIGVTVLLEVPQEQDEEVTYHRMDAVGEALRAAARQVARMRPDCKPTGVVYYRYPGEDFENAARCSFCGVWTSDSDKPNRIDGLATGFTLDGQYMCEQCRVRRLMEGEKGPQFPPSENQGT